MLVSLSVSTSNSGSPSVTVSPTFLSHLLTVPSVMVRPSLGITTTLAMVFLLMCSDKESAVFELFYVKGFSP